MKLIEKEFFNTFTDFQCLILAHMNRGDINGVTAAHYNIIEFIMRKGTATGRKYHWLSTLAGQPFQNS